MQFLSKNFFREGALVFFPQREPSGDPNAKTLVAQVGKANLWFEEKALRVQLVSKTS